MSHATDDHRLQTLLDACRVDSDDLSLPEMGELATALRKDDALRQEWDRRQRSERVVREAMHDVQAPVGLAERILAAAAQCDQQQRAVELPERQVSARRASRRQWIAIAASLAAVVLAAVVVQFWPRSPEIVTQAQLASDAQLWFDQSVANRGKWLDSWKSATVSFPAQAITASPRGWQPLPANREPGLVAFNLTPPGSGGNAVLFAVQTRRKYSVGSLPYTKLTATGGLAMGAWQVGDVLYVLVVDTLHGNQRLDDFIREQRLAMAR